MTFYAGLDLGQSNDYTAILLLEQFKETQEVTPSPSQQNPPSVWTFRSLDGSGDVATRAFDGTNFVPTTAPGGWYNLDEIDQMPVKAPVRPKTILRYEVRGIRRYRLGTSYPDIVEDVCDLVKRPEVRGKISLLIDGTGVGRPVVDMFWRRIGRVVIPIQITAGNIDSRAPDGYWHVPKRDLIGAVQLVLQEGRIKLPKNSPEAHVLVQELQDYQVKITESAHDTYNARQGQHDDLVLALALPLWYAERGGGGLGIYF